MFSTGTPWEQMPEYVAACRTELQPGEPNTYFPPRNVGASPTDVTGFQVGSAHWNIDNLPNVCYLLNPPVEWEIFRKSPRPAQKRDQSGQLMWERDPWPGTAARPLLDFPILRNIDTISTQVEWEWLELIMRLDPRLTWDDIDMRMEYVGARAVHDYAIDTASENVTKQAVKAKNKFVNALQTRCSRGRAAFTMLSWRERTRKSKANKTRDNVLKQLSAEQIANNTTRGSTPGILNPLLPDTPANRVSRRRPQSQPITSQSEQLGVQEVRPRRLLAAGHLGVPLTVPSTQHSRKRKAPVASLTPLPSGNTRGSNDGSSKMKRKRATKDVIHLTQSDGTDASSESSGGNNAPRYVPFASSESSTGDNDSASSAFADLHMYANQQRLLDTTRVQHTHTNWHPTGISTRTPNPPNSYLYHPAPPTLALSPMIQPAFGTGALTAQHNAAVNGPNWGQGWGYHYPNDGFAPFTGEENGHQYIRRRPTRRGPNSYSFYPPATISFLGPPKQPTLIEYG